MEGGLRKNAVHVVHGEKSQPCRFPGTSERLASKAGRTRWPLPLCGGPGPGREGECSRGELGVWRQQAVPGIPAGLPFSVEIEEMCLLTGEVPGQEVEGWNGGGLAGSGGDSEEAGRLTQQRTWGAWQAVPRAP